MKKYQKQLKNNLRFLGNVPVKIFNSYLDDYYAKENDLTPIKLKFEISETGKYAVYRGL